MRKAAECASGLSYFTPKNIFGGCIDNAVQQCYNHNMRKVIKNVYLRIYCPVVLAALNFIRTQTENGKIIQVPIAIETAIVSHASRMGFNTKSLDYAPANQDTEKETQNAS